MIAAGINRMNRVNEPAHCLLYVARNLFLLENLLIYECPPTPHQPLPKKTDRLDDECLQLLGRWQPCQLLAAVQCFRIVELTLTATAIRMGDVTDADVTAHHVSPADFAEMMEQGGEEYRVMFEWFNEHGYESPIDKLQAEHGLTFSRLPEYLERAGWAQ